MKAKVIVVTPTIVGASFSAGDAVGSKMTFTLPGLCERSLLLQKAELLDDAASPASAALDLYLFNSGFAGVADNAAFAITQADFAAGKILYKAQFLTYEDTPIGTNAGAKLSVASGLNFIVPFSGDKIYGQLVTPSATPTYAAGQLLVALHVAGYD